MNLRLKLFTGLLVALVLIIAGFKFLMPKEAIKKVNPNIMMAVNGDPRMLICSSPKDGNNANPAALALLGIDTPLALSDKDKAIYRISILRKTGANTIVTFSTPKSGAAGHVKVINHSGIAGSTPIIEEQDLLFEQANDIVYSYEQARIWGDEKPTLRPKRDPSTVSAVIEIMAPKNQRCIATRYDDENIRPILRAYMKRVPSVLTKTSLAGFAPPEDTIFGKEYAPDKK